MYKVLNADGSPAHGGSGIWSLPNDGQPGEWMPDIKGVEMCKRGYHACRESDLIFWLGPDIYEAERDEAAEYVECDTPEESKVVCGRMRLIRRLDTWNERTARLFACDCAEGVLHICGDDKRPAEAIRVARLFANGKATAEELAAARTSASAAAWAAAGAAAREAAAAWEAAWAAAWTAAWEAARTSAWEAAWEAAREAAREAQTKNLFAYLRGEKGGA